MKKFLILIMLLIPMIFIAKAQDQFVAEIRIFSGNFAPKGWAFCNGQLLSISQNTALFSLLGTTYGGDGKTTFALPNLNGRVPIEAGQGPGLSIRDLGETGGEESVTLLSSEIPAHSHIVTNGSTALPANNGIGNLDTPSESYPATSSKSYSSTSNATMNTTGTTATVDPAGGNLPHNNLQPYLTLRYIIALQGIYPPRN